MAVLEVEELGVTLRSLPVLDGVGFTIERAQRVGLIGESGSGKSVTALAVIGLLPPHMSVTGRVRLDGEDLLDAGERRRSELRGDRITMVFQEPATALNPLMRVGRQVAEPLRLHRGMGRREAHARALELLAHVGFSSPARQARAFPHELSGGQRQRVMLAMAVACEPAVILADEPTTALDVTVQQQVLGLLLHLVEETGAALLLVSHDLAVVSSVCDELLVMYGGRLVESGPTGALLGDPRHPYTAGLVATAAAISPEVPAEAPAEVPSGAPSGASSGAAGQEHGRRVLPTIPGSVPALGAFPSGCVFRTRCPREIPACSTVPPLAPAAGGRRLACWNPEVCP